MAYADTIANAPAHPDFPFAATLDALSTALNAAGKPHLLRPRMGIVCGSGLSTLGSHLRDKIEVPYAEIPGFGHSSGTFPIV
jgi:purine-nucleoside phosphorylase